MASRSSRPRAALAKRTVRLTGIRLRAQGTHDSFCAYYAAAMLLCTLRPEMDDDFDATHVKRDPLFANLPRRKTRALERVVSEWLTTGVHFKPLAQSLTRACKRGTRFSARRAKFNDATLGAIRADADRGLPTVLGWESRELGNHTVLVIGYDRIVGRASPHRWIRVMDPTRGQDIIEWGQLARVATAPADVISCVAHDGVRPDKLTIDRDVENLPLRSIFERWDPKRNAWQTLVTRKSP
jgi:hypothetical protein